MLLLWLLICVTSCSCSLHSQLSDAFRTEHLRSMGGGRGAAGGSGSSASLYGSLPRQAPPPIPFAKPAREGGLSPGLQQGPSYPTCSQTSSPRPLRHLDRDKECGSVRRGSFVERCQELAKGSEAAVSVGFPPGSEGIRRSLAVCSELEAKFGLRTPPTFTVPPAARHSPGPPSSLSSSPISSSLHRRTSPASPPSPASAAVSPTRSQASVSPRHNTAASPVDSSGTPESPPGPDSPTPSGPPTSPKPHMNETSF